MLAQAAKAYKAPTKNDDLAKQLFPSSSPAQNGNIEEQFKKAHPSSQSIGGFMGGITNTSNPLGTRSSNIKETFKRKSGSMSTAPSTSGLTSILSKSNSFQDTPNTIYPTQGSSAFSHPAVEFNENDFDSDLDIDADEDYPSTLPMAAPPKPLQKMTNISQSPCILPQLPGHAQPNGSQNIPSSAVTWSSSSPSHRAPPPGPRQNQQHGISSKEADPNPRPAKRRTLPWLQNSAEEDENSARNEELDSSPPKTCFRCKKPGHFVNDCPNRGKGKGTAWDFTPLPKDKKMPWNQSASAVKERQRVFKGKQKASKKADQAQIEAMEQHNKKKKAVMAPITLSGEQRRVLDLVIDQQKSVFFTGSAGTGKSVLMRAIIAELRKKYVRDPDRIAVTASTGLAACNIGGVTLHSFGGIGLGKEDVPTLVKKIKRNPKAKNRWIKTKILIIDEISMVDGDLFDKLEAIARAMRNNGRPFGGIQLVITGDFFQLPPVPDYENKARGAKFAFDAGTWATAIHHTIGLTEVFRQKDPVFANMLNEMRLGKITDETVRSFKSMNRKVEYEDSLTATELFPTRQEVDNSNAFRMRDLQGKSYTYEALDTGTITDMAIRDKLLANMMAPKTIELKKGAQVMLIKNMDESLVNGSLGKVVAFMSETQFDIWDKHPDVLDETIDDDELDETSKELRNTIKRTYSRNKDPLPETGKLYPLVQFSVADGTFREILVQPEEWKIELPSGEVQAQRSQLPLILAWALSIHKAQGQTLERVKIDLKKIFEKGQAYVALSRATSQAGLEVHNFDKSKVMAHPRVAQFYNSLYSVNKALEHPKVAKPLPKKAKDYEEDFMIAEMAELARSKTIDFDEEEEAMAAYG